MTGEEKEERDEMLWVGVSLLMKVARRLRQKGVQARLVKREGSMSVRELGRNGGAIGNSGSNIYYLLIFLVTPKMHPPRKNGSGKFNTEV